MTILVIFTFLLDFRCSKAFRMYLSLFDSTGSIQMRFSVECHDTSSHKHKIVLLVTTLPLFMNMALAKLATFYSGTTIDSLTQTRSSDKKYI